VLAGPWLARPNGVTLGPSAGICIRSSARFCRARHNTATMPSNTVRDNALHTPQQGLSMFLPPQKLQRTARICCALLRRIVPHVAAIHSAATLGNFGMI
jgi:hypothetical protein